MDNRQRRNAHCSAIVQTIVDDGLRTQTTVGRQMEVIQMCLGKGAPKE